MGREIKRVALDFNWPMSKTWEGYINPHWRPCPERDRTCFGGSTAAGQWLDALCRMFGTVADSGLGGPELRERGILWPHPYLIDFPTAPTHEIPDEIAKSGIAEMQRWMGRIRKDDFVLAPTREFAEFYAGLTGEKGDSPFGFIGSTGAWRLGTKLRELAGVSESWGTCPTCKGEGMDPAVADAYEAWEKTEPPAGEGWQVWETVSEGSPVTPVLPTAEALVDYLCTVGDDWTRKSIAKGDGHRHLPTREQAAAFVKAGWVPSAMYGPGGFRQDIECASK